MNYGVMILIMIVAGFLSIMSIWSNKSSDIRISLNDIFMVSLMTGWMILFMSIFYKNITYFLLGLIVTIISYIFIRKQLFITEKQYIKGMIPHHSMAIMMSKRLRDKGITNPQLEKLVNDIIINQEEEINTLKSLEN